jgi:hypothetical protein
MSKKKPTELRVFKLRSGEEIIAKVAGKTRGKIKLHRPMRIINNIQTDPYTGLKRHSIYCSDWLGSTSEIHANIPTDFVVVELSPDPDLVALYARQTEADDINQGIPSVPPAPPVNISEEDLQKINEEMEEKLDEFLQQYSSGSLSGATLDLKNAFSDFNKADPKAPLGLPPLAFPFMPLMGGNMPPRMPNAIIFSVSIPQDIMASWVESGFLDYLKDCVQDFTSTDFLEELLNEEEDEVEDKPKKPKKPKREKISKDDWKEPTEDLKNKPNYGNSHDDWSPYLKDYMPEQEPPKNTDEG